MNKLIRNLGLIGIVLGATAFSGCAPDNSRNKEKPNQNESKQDRVYGPINSVYPLIEDGVYKGMKYFILNKNIAEETKEDPFIEIRDSEKFLRVNYDSKGSVKSIDGDLIYHQEAVKKIIENDIAFKSNFWIKREYK